MAYQRDGKRGKGGVEGRVRKGGDERAKEKKKTEKSGVKRLRK